jgi:soluble lytic murein transglycosylase
VPAAPRPIDLARADVLFASRQYADARSAYDRLAGQPGVDRTFIALRRALCDFHLRRYEAARAELASLRERAERHGPTVEYYHLSAVRALRREAEYLSLVRTFVTRYPGDPLVETALNDLATHHILANDDERAIAVFEEILERFPAGAFADRAAWRAGWWAYRKGRYEKAIRIFEPAAVTFPRADYRPAWLYWTARAYEELGQAGPALAAYHRTVVFYRNLYYGREAMRRADAIRARVGGAAGPPPAAHTFPPVTIANEHRLPAHVALVVQDLLAAGLYDDAISELRFAGEGEGPSPFIEATIAYALNRKGELRPAITTMRRAYPQFMAAGGEALPVSILKVIFPLAYWDLIRQEAARHRLDPYLVAALVAQESTFQADVRSPANAWGLMQIVPGTGRRYAARLAIPRFSTARLTDPTVNVRIGTTYLADLMKRFGDVAHALAAYNAGENRVVRWRAERPGLDRDEFIDDIPFPETQNYVKRILGTTEDYRLLYGGGARP